jgi:hypothetical protein
MFPEVGFFADSFTNTRGGAARNSIKKRNIFEKLAPRQSDFLLIPQQTRAVERREIQLKNGIFLR